ncbi:FitA-like ribbon-helix-helix domain-containing protein [Nitratireductor soli]|uniref:FitA-like ribbon-helix-helix domain-containing protein n=1 Tax=Nitratireductor soli TaxID=1670619 RepID=UPI00065DE684|nr:plasmid stabilization protein [Nitratireductor soli]
MATLTIRNVDDDVRRALRKRAAENDVSMEEEVRRILAWSVSPAAKAAAPQRRRPSVSAMRKLAVKPNDPFDLKTICDEIWDEGVL